MKAALKLTLTIGVLALAAAPALAVGPGTGTDHRTDRDPAPQWYGQPGYREAAGEHAARQPWGQARARQGMRGAGGEQVERGRQRAGHSVQPLRQGPCAFDQDSLQGRA